MKRRPFRIILILLVIVLVGMQFVRPSLDNPPVTADLQAPPEVKAILKRACYDCHSNETSLKWFDYPQPAYSMVVKHVKEGRAVLNFSNWDSLGKDQQRGKLFESLNQIVFHVMPVKQYRWFHGEAAISAADIDVLRRYCATMAVPAKKDTTGAFGHVAIPDPANVQHAPNGLEYLKGYDGWAAISVTERFDNGTMRIIYGNAIAAKAITEGKTKVWPDGTVFAKVAWEQVNDTPGLVRTGKFLQTELMVKDAAKYASTGGWGWGRWKGGELKPYGKDAYFTTECVNCHRPMSDKDLVFTEPVTPVGGVGGKMQTFWIDKHNGAMGLDYDSAGQRRNKIWAQREDPNWFGAFVPKS